MALDVDELSSWTVGCRAGLFDDSESGLIGLELSSVASLV